MNIKHLCISLILLVWLPVEACHTPARSAIIGKKYPDADFVKLMHAAHSQPYTGYQFKGAQNCTNGTADEFSCLNIDLKGHLELAALGGGQGSDSWGWKHQASGRYFALVGRSNGTSFVEITDPENPIFIGQLPTTLGSSAWRDIKTYNNHAYIVADAINNHGMQVFDLTRLLSVKNKPETFVADRLYTAGAFQFAHNIVINQTSGFAYLVGGNTCNGGLHMVNIQNPINPTFAGCFSADGYTHDAQCLTYSGPDQDYQGREICFASNEDTVTVVDVTVKNNPAQLSRTGYKGSQYTHQGWLTEDQRYFVIDDELDEWRDEVNTRTLVMDFRDLDNPVYKGFHESDGASIDHNQYIVGSHTYQANYSRGLRILELGDLSEPEMREVAFFDTHPEGDGVGFPGAWNVYPFFDNGLVIVSDINRGVFILQPNLPEVDLIFIDGFD
ncbi:choice-of-anchor B family protein [Marinicella sp. S1101]|uniref:choice-of-anchor B family protein n=1 Tax=Marinicella marina TaxID=2996016 RepID=UPI002260EB3E|nr:choice-of-anchor B family protein [Marinicella marina]MCX7553431.1 choice-of-anchor B family protein [Marinicella marina]MDJ1140055.1 choice-of-anchor B family protein [Marinicella marina]